jgi:electron transfer flavoprotein beta subunit
VRLKESLGVRLTAVTMGPPAAEKAVRFAVAMGCDEGVVVSDRALPDPNKVLFIKQPAA